MICIKSCPPFLPGPWATLYSTKRQTPSSSLISSPTPFPLSHSTRKLPLIPMTSQNHPSTSLQVPMQHHFILSPTLASSILTALAQTAYVLIASVEGLLSWRTKAGQRRVYSQKRTKTKALRSILSKLISHSGRETIRFQEKISNGITSKSDELASGVWAHTTGKDLSS